VGEDGVLRLVHRKIEVKIDERCHQIRFTRAHWKAEQIIRVGHAIKQFLEDCGIVNTFRRLFDCIFKTLRDLLSSIVLLASYFDDAKYDEMLANKEIASNLKASKEQIIDDLNGVLSPIQRRVMKELLSHLDELNEHIRNLDDDIDRFMKQEDKNAADAIQEIPGIAATSAQVIISVIGNDMSRFPSDRHLSKWAGLCPGNNESASKRKSGKTTK
jgi:transposase